MVKLASLARSLNWAVIVGARLSGANQVEDVVPGDRRQGPGGCSAHTACGISEAAEFGYGAPCGRGIGERRSESLEFGR